MFFIAFTFFIFNLPPRPFFVSFFIFIFTFKFFDLPLPTCCSIQGTPPLPSLCCVFPIFPSLHLSCVQEFMTVGCIFGTQVRRHFLVQIFPIDLEKKTSGSPTTSPWQLEVFGNFQLYLIQHQVLLSH